MISITPNINTHPMPNKMNKGLATSPRIHAKSHNDSISFSGNKPSLLSRILKAFKPAEKVNVTDTFFHAQLIGFSQKRKDCFMIFSPKGEKLHIQKEGDYDIGAKTQKKFKGNVLVLRQGGDPLNLELILDNFKKGVSKLFISFDKPQEPISLMNPHKTTTHHQTITYPELTPAKAQKATKMMETIAANLDANAHGAVMMEALHTGAPVICNNMHGLKESIRPEIEAPLFNKFIQKLGIKIEEGPAI